MAIELRVTVAVINTDPGEGEARVMLRSRRDSSLVAEGGDDAATLVVARHRLKAQVDECATDIDGQLEIAERNVNG